jgi:hypothetical protein
MCFGGTRHLDGSLRALQAGRFGNLVNVEHRSRAGGWCLTADRASGTNIAIAFSTT